MKMLLTLATWFLVLGGIVIGYGVIGGKDLLQVLLGAFPLIHMIVGVLIGISALFVAYTTVTKQV